MSWIRGWDVRKALQLFRKPNLPLLEWLDSPIVYLEAGRVAAGLRELAPISYSPVACMYHYFKMAKGNFRDYLRNDRVRLKKICTSYARSWPSSTWNVAWGRCLRRFLNCWIVW